MTLLALLIRVTIPLAEILGGCCRPRGSRWSVSAMWRRRSIVLRQQKFDALVLDFEKRAGAAEAIEEGRRLNSGNAPVTVALVGRPRQCARHSERRAHFVLHKPAFRRRTRKPGCGRVDCPAESRTATRLSRASAGFRWNSPCRIPA